MSVAAALPENEKDRLEKLRSYRVLDTGADERFERVTRVARAHVDAPMALISLVDESRQWFKSRLGVDAKETGRDVSFCAHAILSRNVMIIEDALLDERFATNPLVTGHPHIRFYAGAPLITEDGFALGSLCVLDRKPRHLSTVSQQILVDLAAIAVDELELFRHLSTLEESNLALHDTKDRLQRHNRALEISASTDSLTGLANRRGFLKGLTGEWRRASRDGLPISLLMIDVDHFKNFNDRFGHPEGDRCLEVAAAAILSSIRRPGDLAARYGGEEFAVILPATAEAGALAIGKTICREIAALKLQNPGTLTGFVTVSVGAATMIPLAGATETDLVTRADTLLYKAKNEGRNRVCGETG